MEEKIVIDINRTSLFAKFFLGFILLISALTPIFTTIGFILNGKGIHFSLILPYIISWGIGFYILKAFLWNIFGTENIILKKENISYYCDYKYIVGPKKELESSLLKIEVIDDGYNKGKLKIWNEKDSFETVISKDINDMENIKSKIELFYSFKL